MNIGEEPVSNMAALSAMVVNTTYYFIYRKNWYR
jgi:uncharacterized membrane protein